MKTLVLTSASDENCALLIEIAQKLGFSVTEDNGTVNEPQEIYQISASEKKEITAGLKEILDGKGLSSEDIKNRLKDYL